MTGTFTWNKLRGQQKSRALVGGSRPVASKLGADQMVLLFARVSPARSPA
jgi:hypothetical protein